MSIAGFTSALVAGNAACETPRCIQRACAQRMMIGFNERGEG